jgi:hypothetical protein
MLEGGYAGRDDTGMCRNMRIMPKTKEAMGGGINVQVWRRGRRKIGG